MMTFKIGKKSATNNLKQQHRTPQMASTLNDLIEYVYKYQSECLPATCCLLAVSVIFDSVLSTVP